MRRKEDRMKKNGTCGWVIIGVYVSKMALLITRYFSWVLAVHWN